MIKSNPFIKLSEVSSAYCYDHNGHNLMEMWESKAFGGCVFNKIRKKDGGSITNFLSKKVKSYDIQYLYGGGYYILENLPDPENNQILDVYILIEDVNKFDDMNYLKELFAFDHTRNHHNIEKKNTPTPTNHQKMRSEDASRSYTIKMDLKTVAELKKETRDITFNDIHESITGFARIIKYQAIYGDCFSKDVSLLKIQSLEEGEFVAGKKNGYCRVIHGDEKTVDFGMYKNDVPEGKFGKYTIDIPDGKYVEYNIDETFESHIGIF